MLWSQPLTARDPVADLPRNYVNNNNINKYVIEKQCENVLE